MIFSRRDTLKALGSAALGAIASKGYAAPGPSGNASGPSLYLAANDGPDGVCRVAGLAPDGSAAFELPLPKRGHGFAIRPRGKDNGNRQAVAFARRPGDFAIVIDLVTGKEVSRLEAPKQRHFYGHGTFSRDGGLLYTAENDYNNERGRIGVWNAANGYRRLGDFPSFGIGPHELILMPDGKTLAIANGGILTHPDTGRGKLNIPTMMPSLAYIDAGNGTLRARHGFTDPRLRKLSIRHLAATRDGTLCIALQDQGPWRDSMPLVAFHRQQYSELVLGQAPDKIARRLRGYMGAVALDSSSTVAAVSAPRGGLVTFWNMVGWQYLGAQPFADSCGVAAADGAGRFYATSGQGGAMLFDAFTKQQHTVATPFNLVRQWDNHLAAIL